MRGPELQLRITVGAQPREIVVAAREQVDTGQRLRVAAIESFGEPHDRRQHAHCRTQRAVEVAKALVRLFRGRLAMIARNEGDDLDLLRIEAAEITILDQVIRMAVMPIVADVHADVVQQRRVLEPFALAIAEPVHAPRLVEDAERQLRDLLRMLRPVSAPLAQLDDAAAADVGVAFDFADAGAVPVDVVEHEAFTQCEIAEGEMLGAETAQNRVEKNRSGDAQIGAARIETRDLKPLLDIGLDQPLAQSVQRLRADALIPDILRRCSFLIGDREGAETQNGARRPNHSIETGRGDLLEVRSHLLVEMLHQAPFVM